MSPVGSVGLALGGLDFRVTLVALDHQDEHIAVGLQEL